MTNQCNLICDIIHLESTKVLTTYDRGDQDTLAITKNNISARSMNYVGPPVMRAWVKDLINRFG